MVMVLSMAATLSAKGGFTDPYKNYDEAMFMDMDLNTNILTPAVSPDGRAAVKKYMSNLGRNLGKKGYVVDLTRDDEVIVVTVPAEELFLPNDTVLSPRAPAKLTPITALLADPEMFKVVYTVHTDNTGSDQYINWLSRQRNNSVYDWITTQVADDQIVIPYEMGASDPIEPNTSRKGRAANRRVEFYLIPGPKMITMAHKGTLR